MVWVTTFKKFEWTREQQGGLGSTLYWYEQASGRKFNLWFEATEWVENQVFGYSMTKGDFKSYDERWEIDATPDGCRFIFNDHIEFHYGPIGEIIVYFAAHGAKETGAKILANLKRLAEADVGESQD
jgi:hypothetical protein